MDRQTQRELMKVGAAIPKRLSDNLITEEVDTSEEELARFAIKQGDISKEKKEELARLIEQGAFRRSEKIVNEKVAAEIDRFNSARVEKLRRAGKLPDPMKDRWYQERLAKMRKR